jgi:hypothetical protein
MRLNLTKHARQRMALRKITESDVLSVLDDFGQKSWPNDDGSGTVVVATIEQDRELTVVVAGRRPFREPIKIISVYWFGEDDNE